MPRLVFDFGSETVRMGTEGRQVRLFIEPAVVAHAGGGQIVAIGAEARRMLGRTPAGLDAERPFSGGGVRSQSLALTLLQSLLRHGPRRRWQRPELVIALASGATALDRRAFAVLAKESGAARVQFASLAGCRALGLGLPLFEPYGSLIVDVGATCTRIDLLSLGRAVVSASLPEAGDAIDEAIARRLREEYSLLIGPSTAQSVKHELLGGGGGSALVHGRDVVSGLPRAIEIRGAEIEAPVCQLAEHIAEAVREVLRSASPELVADVAVDGVHLSGGGAQLLGLRRLLPELLGLSVIADDAPEESIARGLQVLCDRGAGRRLLSAPSRNRGGRGGKA